jgi:hypothetical protein
VGGNATNQTASDPRVDELRQRLRSLGYLDASVDRFVLGSARRSQRPSTIALMASLRIGILAAALLGPGAAVGLIARFPGLVTGPRDAVIAALYLGILFGGSVAVAAFAAALVASWFTARLGVGGSPLVRRARVLSIAAGILVAAAVVAYLTLWWGAAAAGPGWPSPIWTMFALAVAVAISLLLGHAVTITALAVIMARPGDAALAARVPAASWKASLVFGTIAFVGSAILLLATAATDSAREPTPLAVASSHARVVVLAIDGFDPQLHDRLRPPDPTAAQPHASGTQPGLFAALDGTRAQLEPSSSRDPARLWTTIATGVRPETHGVSALETRRVAGLDGRLVAGSTGQVIGAATDLLRLTRPAIASTFERRAKMFWEIAEQAGLRTAVVNWWATWPADASGGIVLSDRAVIRLERGGGLDAELAPPDLYEPLKARWPDLRRTAQQLAVGHFANVPEVDLRKVLARSGELDVSMVRLAETIAAGHDLDLLVVYLPGLDVAQHTLLGDAGRTSSAYELNLRLTGLQRYYRFLDFFVHPIISRAAREGARVFVLTQAGRLHEGSGLLAGLGPDLRSGVRANGTVLDVAPTILHVLGVPVARDLDGRVLTDLFDPEFVAKYPVREVETYGRREPIAAVRGDAPLDREVIERLRSLGYVR